MSGFARNVAITALGAVAANLVTFAASPLLTRLYDPDQFGIWAVFLAVAFAIPVMAGLRYEVAVVLPRRVNAARHLVLVILGISLLFTSIAAMGVLAVQLWLPRKLMGSFPVEILWFLPVMIPVTAIFQAGLAWWTRQHAFGRIAVARMILVLVTLAVQLVYGRLVGGAEGLILGTVIGQALAAGFVLVWSLRSLFDGFHPSWRRMLAMAQRYRRVAIYTAPYTLQGQGHRQGIVFLLGSFGSVALAGFYALAFRVVYYPLTIFSQSLGQVYFPRMAQANPLSSQQDFVIRILSGLVLVFLPGAVVFTLHAPDIMAFVFGEEWREAAPIAVYLMYPSILLVLGAWFERIFDVVGRQRLHLFLDLSANLLTLALFLVGLVMFDGTTAVGLLSIGLSLYYAVWILVAFHVAGFDKMRLWRVVAKTVISGCAAWFIAALLSLAFEGWYLVAFLAAAGLLYYGALGLFLKRQLSMH